MYNKTIQITKIPVIFFIGLYFLIFICFFGSWLSSINFLLTYKLGSAGTLLGRLLFLIFSCFYLIKPETGEKFLNALIHPFAFAKMQNFVFRLNNLTSVFPLTSCLFVYLYLVFLSIHWISLLSSEVELVFEIPYHLLNIVKIFLFPAFLYGYILLYSPANLNLDGEFVKEAIKSLYGFLKETAVKYPKATKGGKIISSLFAIGASTATYHGYKVKTSVKDITQIQGMPGLKDLNTPDCLQDGPCKDLLIRLIKIHYNANSSKLDISVEDLNRVISGNPTLLNEFKTILEVLPLVQSDLIEKAALREKQRIAAELGSTPTSRTVDLSQSNDVMDELPSSSLIAKSSPSSPLEEFWFFF